MSLRLPRPVPLHDIAAFGLQIARMLPEAADDASAPALDSRAERGDVLSALPRCIPAGPVRLPQGPDFIGRFLAGRLQLVAMAGDASHDTATARFDVGAEFLCILGASGAGGPRRCPQFGAVRPLRRSRILRPGRKAGEGQD